MDNNLKEAAELLSLHLSLLKDIPGMYPGIQGAVAERLKELDREIQDKPKEPDPKTVTPPEGPANSALEHRDGTLERKPPEPNPAVVAQQNLGSSMTRPASPPESEPFRAPYDPGQPRRYDPAGPREGDLPPPNGDITRRA